ncbi:MAG TPA: hypothetical protein VN282_05120 [Pyrinomonadaceae bacterium]|nr:hypothetical protein [Pyrinomonadaceae bacterium]
MPGLRILLIVLVALMLAGAWAALRKRRRARPMLTQARPLPELKGSLDASAGARRIDVALGREIARLLETGRRPEAVALVRERTGWGAREADEAVGKLEGLRKRLG